MRSNIYNRIAPIKPSHYRERKARKIRATLYQIRNVNSSRKSQDKLNTKKEEEV